jgi:3-hydroxybutyrate dehydrogenase
MTQPAFPSPDYHRGRRALVTGAASGIGLACAEKFAALGAQVIAVDLNAEGLAALAERVDGIVPTPCDLSDLAGLADALPHDVDIVVNNAGIQTGRADPGVPGGEASS